MNKENILTKRDLEKKVTLESFISDTEVYQISSKALCTGFKHRQKVEFLKFFIV